MRLGARIKAGLRARLQAAGFDLVRHPALPADLDPLAREIVARVRPFTMTSAERICALVEAMRHVEQSGIPGDVVECGVWRGGSMMAAALTLIGMGVTRDLHLFDTFEGMPPPGQKDRDAADVSADRLLSEADRSDSASVWCVADQQDVRRNLATTGYPSDRLHFHPGRVEKTLPAEAPASIALLRLDTDWYESTLHELVHLYPRLAPGGVLIIDDYGAWKGARAAVDEYFETLERRPLLHRIDFTGRICVKPG